MTTPLKALIQERLLAKIVQQEVDEEDDDHNTVSARHQRPSSSSSGSMNARVFPLHHLQTQIDPSAYLVPSPHSQRFESNQQLQQHHCHNSQTRLYGYNGSSTRYSTSSYVECEYHQHTHHSCLSDRATVSKPEHIGDNRYVAKHSHPLQSTHFHHTSAHSSLGATSYNSHNRSESPWKRVCHSFEYEQHESPSSLKRVQRSSHSENEIHGATEAINNKKIRSCSPKKDDAWSTYHNHKCHSPQHLRHRHHHYQQQHQTSPSEPEHDNQAAHDHIDEHERMQQKESPKKRTEYESRYNQQHINSPLHPPYPHQHFFSSSNRPSHHLPSVSTSSLPTPLDIAVVEGRVKERPYSSIISPHTRHAATVFIEKRQRRAAKWTPRTLATQRWLQSFDMIDAEAQEQQQQPLPHHPSTSSPPPAVVVSQASPASL